MPWVFCSHSRTSYVGLTGTSGPRAVARFFSVAPNNLERARAICGGCPVRADCYSYAIGDPDLEGMWAGFTSKERREIRRQRVA